MKTSVCNRRNLVYTSYVCNAEPTRCSEYGGWCWCEWMGNGGCRQLRRRWKGEQMSLVDEVKARLTIVDVVSDYLALDNPSSRTPKALCPFHEERTPSFSLSLDHDSWRCWGACGVGGDMFGFVMRADGLEFKGALDKLARKAGIEPEVRNENPDGRRRGKASAPASSQRGCRGVFLPTT